LSRVIRKVVLAEGSHLRGITSAPDQPNLVAEEQRDKEGGAPVKIVVRAG
jgi:hypothetical protein